MKQKKSIEYRLAALEQILNPFTSFVWVQTADGREMEIPVAEYVERWKDLIFIRAGRNFDMEALDAVLSIGWEAAKGGMEYV